MTERDPSLGAVQPGDRLHLEHAQLYVIDVIGWVEHDQQGLLWVAGTFDHVGYEGQVLHKPFTGTVNGRHIIIHEHAR